MNKTLILIVFNRKKMKPQFFKNPCHYHCPPWKVQDPVSFWFHVSVVGVDDSVRCLGLVGWTSRSGHRRHGRWPFAYFSHGSCHSTPALKTLLSTASLKTMITMAMRTSPPSTFLLTVKTMKLMVLILV